MSVSNINTGLTALANKASAASLAITIGFNQVSTCTSTNNSCTLPSNPVAGQVITIRNDGVTTLNIFPPLLPLLSTINGLAANISYPLPPASVCTILTGALTANWVTQVSCTLSVAQQIYVAPAAITTTAAITTAQSGSTFVCSSAGGAYTITLPLPAVAGGCRYRFLSSIAQANIVSIGGAATANINGFGMRVGGALLTPATQSSMNFTATSTSGDFMEFWSDGTVWNVIGYSGAAAGLSITA